MSSFAEDPAVSVYGAPWCPQCKRVKKFFAAHRVRYVNVDIDEHPEAVERLRELQAGGQTIPTVVYKDGTHEVNPSKPWPAASASPSKPPGPSTTSSSSAADQPA